MIDSAPSHLPMPPGQHEIIPAATVVVFRRAAAGGPPQLLMLQRSAAMRFAANAAVFPGGRVDPADRELARCLAPHEPEEIAAGRIAAIRETLEEAGLVLATTRPVSGADAARARAMLMDTGRLDTVLDRFGWELALDRLTFFAHWCPPAMRAFDTRFFLADIGTGAVEVTADEVESANLFWITAAEALRKADNGELSLVFPTRRNLERLAQFASFKDAVADARTFEIQRIHPMVVDDKDGKRLTIPAGLGYPVLGEPLATVIRG